MIESTSTFKPREINVASQQIYTEIFPLTISNGDEQAELGQALNWAIDNRVDLLDKLSRHGVILFRGFPLVTDIDFDSMVEAFGLNNFAYKESLSNAVRRNRTERVFTANEAPPDISIYLHHEMAQTPAYPSKLFFFCEQAPTQGGATPLCRSDILLSELGKRLPEFIAKCNEKGVRYANVMPSFDDQDSGQGRSWQSTLSATNRTEAEARLQQLGYTWQWLDDGSLRVTTPVLPIIRELPDGRVVFFNQLIAAFRGWKDSRNESEKSICFGDGSEMSTDDMAEVISLSDEMTYDLNWQTGDMALVDNFLVMHGRRTYGGTRKVLASLAK